MMRRFQMVLAMAGLAPAAMWAQTHVVKRPETVVRAVAVYEWTGPEEKPTGSRLVPVSIYIDAQLQDAGVYLARPVPFSLDVGTVFEMQKAGTHEGTLEIAFQRHLEASGMAPLDNGWLGYGILKPAAAAPATEVAAKQKGPLPQIVASGGKKPQFATKPDADTAGTTTASTDPNRPTMTRRTDSSGTTTSSTDTNKPVLQKRSDSTSSDSSTTSTAADDDPNRPVLVRRKDSPVTDDSTTDTSSTKTGSQTSSRTSPTDSTDDSERPTLKRRTPTTTQGKTQKRQGDVASVQGVGSLNDDPDRPTLHRGTAAPLDIPPLEGVPADMKQLVAVSDAKDRPVHDFARPWESEEERSTVLAKMQELARARLASYDMPAPLVKAPAMPAAKTATSKTKKTAPAVPPPPAPAELDNETLKSYTLSYGGAATFVYTATSPGTKGATRYVTVVAQREPLGDLEQALASVTDSTHLDRTPWMRPVDVVDAEASNRASLLFEMRGEHTRQFALYRVIGARADQVFETGTTQ